MNRNATAEQFNHPNWNVENYDLVRHFVEINNSFPKNTTFMGNNFNKGFIRYDKMIESIEQLFENDSETLFKATTYNLGTRKHYVRIANVLIAMEGIHHKKSELLILDSSENVGEMLPIIGSMTVLHTTDNVPVEIKNLIESCITKAQNVPTIGIISRDNGGFFMTEIKMEAKISHDLELHYGKDFASFHDKLVDKLATTNKGLTLLHGEPGTGKSSYIRKLVYDLKEKTNKKIIIVPNNLIGCLVDPDFNTFLLDTVESFTFEDDENFEFDMKYGDSDAAQKREDIKGMIMILEDAESVLMKRDAGYNNQGTSNILNLTDGLLNDIFGIQIIATYNTTDDNIDDAVKRSKRLIAKRNFQSLSLEDTKKLAKHLKVKKAEIEAIKDGLTVSDIYALVDKDVEDVLIDKNDSRKGTVGFG
jgi:hypothetical protein